MMDSNAPGRDPSVEEWTRAVRDALGIDPSQGDPQVVWGEPKPLNRADLEPFEHTDLTPYARAIDEVVRDLCRDAPEES